MARNATGGIGLVLRLRDDRLIRNNVIYLLGTVASGGLGYVFHFVTGRLLGPDGYAVVASAVASLYILNLPSLVVQIVSARFTSLFAGRDELGSIPRLLFKISLPSLGLGAVIASVLVLFAPAGAAYLHVPDVRIVYVLA